MLLVDQFCSFARFDVCGKCIPQKLGCCRERPVTLYVCDVRQKQVFVPKVSCSKLCESDIAERLILLVGGISFLVSLMTQSILRSTKPFKYSLSVIRLGYVSDIMVGYVCEALCFNALRQSTIK